MDIKKTIVLLVTALLFLASCTDIRFNEQPQHEIGYTTLLCRLNTKTLATNQKVLADSVIFQSYSYMLPKGTAWTYGTTEAKQYFNKDVIVSKVATTGIWQDPTSPWYWPKNYALTFFAWSLNKSNLQFPINSNTTVTCTTNGIQITDYNIELNKNIDLLIADIAADKTQNENVFATVGVPTRFRHKLSQFSATVKKSEDYPNVYFTLNNIMFNSIANTGTYSQDTDKFTVDATRTDQIFTSTDQIVDNTAAEPVENIEQYLYLPQTFSPGETIDISYTIGYDTDGDGNVDFTEVVTKSCELSTLFTDGEFKPGRRYVLNLIFEMNQIYWDPVVDDWEDVNYSLEL